MYSLTQCNISRPESKRVEQKPIKVAQRDWEIVPSYKVMYPPFTLLDTINLAAKFPEGRMFTVQEVQDTQDWSISILPSTGTLSSQENTVLIIKCEPKKSAFPSEESQQEATVKVLMTSF